MSADMLDLSHLKGRCGTCRLWSEYTMGVGTCQLWQEYKSDAPMRGSDFGGVDTRIDFGCVCHEPKPVA